MLDNVFLTLMTNRVSTNGIYCNQLEKSVLFRVTFKNFFLKILIIDFRWPKITLKIIFLHIINITKSCQPFMLPKF